jgi:cytidylate kinase
MSHRTVLAIDGPAGSGKTTSAREVARLLGFSFVDSGALYRAVALAAIRGGVSSCDDPKLPALLDNLPLHAEPVEGSFRVFLAGEEIGESLRGPEVTSLASKLAVDPQVRQRVGRWLRELAEQGPVVIEGRDIGTVVFPDADLKVFLTASLEERARRRTLDLEAHGRSEEVGAVSRRLAERDERDAGRAFAPLRRAPDAVEVDTTRTDIDGQVAQILRAWERVRPPRIGWDYAAHRLLIRWTTRLLWGLTVEGVEGVPRVGGLLVVANHKSYLDPLLLGSVLPREIHYLAKRELFDVPLLGRWVRGHHAIPIDRQGFDRRAITRCVEILRSGGALLVFPEGTRILRPGLGEPLEGVAWIASRADVPILPVHLRGTWAGQRRWFRRGGIRVRIGEPFRLPAPPGGRARRSEYPGIAERILDAVRQLDEGSKRG